MTVIAAFTTGAGSSFSTRRTWRSWDLPQGQIVDLTSHFHGEQRTAEHFMVVPYSIPRRCAAAYFPEANVLVPVDSRDRAERHAAFKICGDHHRALEECGSRLGPHSRRGAGRGSYLKFR